MFKKWIAENAPWLGVMLVAFLGGLVAHVRAFEKASVIMTWRQHVKGMFIRTTYAAVAGLLVYWMAEVAVSYGYKVSEPLVFVCAAVCGMFGSEFFDFIFTTILDKVRKTLGLPPITRQPQQEEK